jgi:hypothetical protein
MIPSTLRPGPFQVAVRPVVSRLRLPPWAASALDASVAEPLPNQFWVVPSSKSLVRTTTEAAAACGTPANVDPTRLSRHAAAAARIVLCPMRLPFCGPEVRNFQKASEGCSEQ